MAKKPQPEKPKVITIHQVKRTRRSIFIAYDKGDEVLTLQSRDNPLPAFHQALDGLAALVAGILHLSPAYTETDFKVNGVTLATQGGARTVSIIGQKSLDDAAKAFKIVTPTRLIDMPTQEGSYTPPLSDLEANNVSAVIEAARAYVLGDRAQGQLPLDGGDGEDEDDDAGEPELPLATAPDAGTSGKPARKRKPKAAPAAE